MRPSRLPLFLVTLLVALFPPSEGRARDIYSAGTAPAWILGEQPYSRLGQAYGPGDLNGDGVDDLLLAAPYLADPSVNQGRAYLFLGGEGRFHRGMSVDDADATFTGTGSYDFMGWGSNRRLDFDSDGWNDLLVGAWQFTGEFVDQGRIYIFRGGPGFDLQGEVELSQADYVIEGGGRWNRIGFEIEPAGDMDGDGMTDLAIGSPFMAQNPVESQVWLLLTGRWNLAWDDDEENDRGNWPPSSGSILRTSDPGFMVLNGDLLDSETGWSVWGGRDLNGDGRQDMLVGAPRFSQDEDEVFTTGKVYFVAGRPLSGSEEVAGWDAVQTNSDGIPLLELGLLSGSFLGGNISDELGYQVLMMGDVTGDGLGEALFSAPGAELGDEPVDIEDPDISGSDYASGSDSGVVYCHAGRDGGWSGSLLEDVATGTVEGASQGELLGAALALLGEGTGEEELLLGAPSGYFGEVAPQGVVYQMEAFRACDGPATSQDAEIAWVGLREGDLFGRYLAVLGDVNGDGQEDWAVGAPSSALAGAEGGAVFLLGPGMFADRDGDGVSGVEGDCDDSDSGRHPGEGEDQDCDGYSSQQGDCQDGDPVIRPGAVETCDGVDENCDGEVDEGTECSDPDGDGYTLLTGDCDEGLANVHIDALDDCDGIDNDCDGAVDEVCESGCSGCSNLSHTPHPAGLVWLGGLVAMMVLGRRRRVSSWMGALLWMGGVGEVGAAEFYLPEELSLKEARATFTSSQERMRLYLAAPGGDITGDGLDDLLLGDWRASVNDVGDGVLAIFPGGTEPFGQGTPATDAPIGYWGSALLDNLGFRTSPAFDVNGDGLADLVLAAPGNNDEGNDNKGRVWILWGTTSLAGWNSASALETRFDGSERSDRFGKGAAGVGDIDGDGYADLALGNPFTHVTTPDLDMGIVYLFMGAPRESRRWNGGEAKEFATAFIAGTHFDGALGHDIAPAGDVDGDGLADLLVGAVGWTLGNTGPIAPATPGRTYLFSGANLVAALGEVLGDYKDAQEMKEVSLYASCASFTGEEEEDLTSQVIGTLGDVDGDGLADLFFGAPWATREGDPYIGRGYLILGSQVAERCNKDGFQDGSGQGALEDDGDTSNDGEAVVGRFNLGTNSTTVFLGSGAGDQMGHGFTDLGDIDQDGFDDFLVSAPGDDRSGEGTGRVFLFLGRPASQWPSQLSADEADAVMVVPGPDTSFGLGVAQVGDLDGDGRREFAVGGPVDDTWGVQRGQVWLLSVGDFYDDDGDGANEFQGDCNDTDPAVRPGSENPDVDADCDGVTPAEGDCDDGEALSFPGGVEVEDGVDNDCNGGADEGFPGADLDGDGATVGEGDCNDTDTTISPLRSEICNGHDDNCDGVGDPEECGDSACVGCGSSPGPDVALSFLILLGWPRRRRRAVR